jgi:hypothetical protein
LSTHASVAGGGVQPWHLQHRLIFGLSEDELRTVISDSVTTISPYTGRDVAGFLAPAISATETFFDLLPEFGIRYTVDMTPDDQPVPLKVRGGKLIAMPYSTEINDIRVMGVRGFTAQEWAGMVMACFDQLYREATDSGMIMCMSVPTVNPKRLSIACESVDNHGDGRSAQVDLIRRGRAVPVARSLANRSSHPSASAQCAEA